MIKTLLAAGSVMFLVAACLPSQSSDLKAATAVSRTEVPGATAQTKSARANPAEVPEEITIPSSVGEVVFHHQIHIRDLGVKCVDCHHQIDAKKLVTPHPDYLKSSWVNCNICHNGSDKPKDKVVYTCSECHHTSPANIADETLSTKIVVHKQCWKCHEAGVGKDASKSCEFCHSGKKNL